MKVALEFPDNCGRGVRWIEVTDVADLRKQLSNQNVRTVCRYSRCIATDDGRCDGSFIDLDKLSDDDLAWASDSEPVRSRFLLCATA